jgi:hypothetical protein
VNIQLSKASAIWCPDNLTTGQGNGSERPLAPLATQLVGYAIGLDWWDM